MWEYHNNDLPICNSKSGHLWVRLITIDGDNSGDAPQWGAKDDSPAMRPFKSYHMCWLLRHAWGQAPTNAYQLTKAELDVTGANWFLTATAPWQAGGEIMGAKANKTDHLEMDRKRFEVTQYSFSCCQEVS